MIKTAGAPSAIASTLLMGVACSSARAESAVATDASALDGSSGPLTEITVTARRIELIGKASTASEGVVADEEIQLAPTYRPGQILETVPGLIVTLHSGEGKANQYLRKRCRRSRSRTS
jgi:outer membrane cobalamin receptor